MLVNSLMEVVKDSVHIQEMLNGSEQDEVVLDELEANQTEQNRLIGLITGLPSTLKTSPV